MGLGSRSRSAHVVRLAARFALAATDDQDREEESREDPKHCLHDCLVHLFLCPFLSSFDGLLVFVSSTAWIVYCLICSRPIENTAQWVDAAGPCASPAANFRAPGRPDCRSLKPGRF